ncbi:hypothetical protein J6590_078722 [Homalodisca vitripennis]|nr:hypothetical protein J6590_078722 [Homalodisca vitripennis]
MCLKLPNCCCGCSLFTGCLLIAAYLICCDVLIPIKLLVDYVKDIKSKFDLEFVDLFLQILVGIVCAALILCGVFGRKILSLKIAAVVLVVHSAIDVAMAIYNYVQKENYPAVAILYSVVRLFVSYYFASVLWSYTDDLEDEQENHEYRLSDVIN